MKTIRLKNEKTAITREMISKFGEVIYHSSGVDSVMIRLEFKDGSSIGFKREEFEDEIDRRVIGGKE